MKFAISFLPRTETRQSMLPHQEPAEKHERIAPESELALLEKVFA